MDDKEEQSPELFEHTHQYQHLMRFFKERFALIEENKYPLMLTTDPASRFILHLVPENFLRIQFDIKRLDRPENYCIPIGAIENMLIHEFDFDGIFFLSIRHEKKRYTQVFRNGIIESVVAMARKEGASNLLDIFNFQESIKKSLTSYLAVYRKFSVPGPYYLFMRMWHVEGIRIEQNDIQASGYDPKGLNKPLARNDLVFPMCSLPNCESNLDHCLLAFFDILWNMFGFRGVPST